MMKGRAVLSLTLLLTCQLVAQSSGPGNDTASGHKAASTAPGEPGFSIESEVLTYTALRSDSKAVAREIAGYVNELAGMSMNFAPERGSDGGNLKTQAGVVILSSNTASIASFQLWRADIELMRELREGSKSYCLSTAASGEVAGRRGSSEAPVPKSAAGLAALTPFGAALPLVQGMLGMAATTESVSSVRGTVEDQAFMNAVAMELRAQNVSVLMPDTYMPFSLSEASANSPFLSSLNELLMLRACLATQLAQPEERPSVARQETENAKNAIDGFLDTLRGTGSSPARKQPWESRLQTDLAENKPNTSSTFSPSHLISVLQADGLAQGLRSKAWQHILWLEALESGGSVTKTGNFLTTKTWYSGGAVGSYALFNQNGQLECSGNVYAYVGPLRPKDFQNKSPQTDFDPVVEQSCKTPGERLVDPAN